MWTNSKTKKLCTVSFINKNDMCDKQKCNTTKFSLLSPNPASCARIGGLSVFQLLIRFITARGRDLLDYCGEENNTPQTRLFSLGWFAEIIWEALVAWIRHAPHRAHTSRPAFLPHLRVQVFRCSNSCTEHSAWGSLQQGTVRGKVMRISIWRGRKHTNIFFSVSFCLGISAVQIKLHVCSWICTSTPALSIFSPLTQSLTDTTSAYCTLFTQQPVPVVFRQTENS